MFHTFHSFPNLCPSCREPALYRSHRNIEGFGNRCHALTRKIMAEEDFSRHFRQIEHLTAQLGGLVFPGLAYGVFEGLVLAGHR